MGESFAEANGIKICYEIAGEGDPLFLIHGFGVTKEEWIGQFIPLSKHFKVIRFDSRNSGKSDHPTKKFTFKVLAEDTKALMDALGIDKAHIIGWSVGGMVAQEFAIHYPEKLMKLVLINTFSHWPGDDTGIEMYKQGKIDNMNAVKNDPVKGFYDYATPGFSRKFKKLLMENPKKKIHGLFSAEDLIEKDKNNPVSEQDIENFSYGLSQFNVLDRLSEIKNKTLIIAASHDRSMPVSVNKIIHDNIPNSKFEVIEKAGHTSPIERAPEINELIINFLKS
jgi:3-oxoadipate enol-lactonase